METAFIAIVAGLGAILASVISAASSFLLKARKKDEMEIVITKGGDAKVHVTSAHMSKEDLEKILSTLSEIESYSAEAGGTQISQGATAVSIKTADPIKVTGTEADKKTSGGVPEESERD